MRDVIYTWQMTQIHDIANTWHYRHVTLQTCDITDTWHYRHVTLQTCDIENRPTWHYRHIASGHYIMWHPFHGMEREKILKFWLQSFFFCFGVHLPCSLLCPESSLDQKIFLLMLVTELIESARRNGDWWRCEREISEWEVKNSITVDSSRIDRHYCVCGTRC